MIFSGCSPPGIKKVTTNIFREVGEQVVPVLESILCDLNPVEFKGAEGMCPAFHFHGGSKVMDFLVGFKHIVHRIGDMVKEYFGISFGLHPRKEVEQDFKCTELR